MSDPTFCMIPYHWMIFSGIMLTVYCINGRSEMMSLYLQYRNAHWLIIKNIKNYICPRKSKLPPERYKKPPYIHVFNNPKRRKSGRRLMCLNSSVLRSTDNIKFETDSVDVFLDTCVTSGATHFKNDFLNNTFVPTIENMEGAGGKLTIHGYGSIAYQVQTYDGSCSRGWQPRQARAVPAPVARGRNGPQDHCPMPFKG